MESLSRPEFFVFDIDTLVQQEELEKIAVSELEIGDTFFVQTSRTYIALSKVEESAGGVGLVQMVEVEASGRQRMYSRVTCKIDTDPISREREFLYSFSELQRRRQSNSGVVRRIWPVHDEETKAELKRLHRLSRRPKTEVMLGRIGSGRPIVDADIPPHYL